MMHFLKGNRLTLLRNGSEYFPALVSAINAAKQDIYLQTYIYANDETGKLVGDALMQAANRGVTVNLLIDGFGGKDLAKEYLDELKNAKVDVRFYRPKISPWTFKKSRLRRLHRKVVVIDGTVGFVGGINIINDCEIPGQTPPRLDYALRIEGNLLAAMQASVVKMWQRNHWRSPQAWKTPSFWKYLIPASATTRIPDQSTEGVEAAFVIRDNFFHKHDIEDAYLIAIQQAKSEIIIANAYFLPGRNFRHALIAAARRGVTVKLLLQGRMEYFMMFATHAFYNILLKNHIEIYEYREGFMHSKVAVVDSYWATVGSSNIDPFSLLLAQEANVVVQDEDFAKRLRAELLDSINQTAHQVSPDSWLSHRTKRVCSWIAYGMLKLGLSLIGQATHH
jgi:cardiolipin synthase